MHACVALGGNEAENTKTFVFLIRKQTAHFVCICLAFLNLFCARLVETGVRRDEDKSTLTCISESSTTSTQRRASLCTCIMLDEWWLTKYALNCIAKHYLNNPVNYSAVTCTHKLRS